MNGLNDIGLKHGYWEEDYDNVNYLNGDYHGDYEYYWDKEKIKLFTRGKYNMGTKVGYWEWFLWEYYLGQKNYIEKEFYL